MLVLGLGLVLVLLLLLLVVLLLVLVLVLVLVLLLLLLLLLVLVLVLLLVLLLVVVVVLLLLVVVVVVTGAASAGGGGLVCVLLCCRCWGRVGALVTAAADAATDTSRFVCFQSGLSHASSVSEGTRAEALHQGGRDQGSSLEHPSYRKPLLVSWLFWASQFRASRLRACAV